MNVRRKPFLPCLLDRLLDDEPRNQVEVWDRYHFDARKYREVIQRDITEILNTANIEKQLNPFKHKQVATSVVNYGISPLVGGYSTPHNWSAIERMVRDSLIRFEPRLIKDSIIISLHGDHHAPVSNGILHFEIRALVDWEPQPFELCLSTRYDVETDSAGVTLRS